ncbi:MAG: hydratase [Clostridiales bacterium]|nr:hydratase [Clostridiales bacterium]
MITLYDKPIYTKDGQPIFDENILQTISKKDLMIANENTIAYGILKNHNVSDDPNFLNIKFDSLCSHDITYVGIIQTAMASGLTSFPLPYILTCCHNSLCAVGGTINEDDHVFGLSAARKFGGVFVPPHMAVIHQYMREMMAGCGKMILGSDSHTRYGPLGTMAVGEGGPELVKQLLNRTWDTPMPKIIGVHITGKPRAGVGPQDVALALIEATFKNGFVKNEVLEFFGDGIDDLSIDYRNGIDVMTTETTCLSSIWQTDEKVQEYLAIHGRAGDYKKLNAQGVAKYDRLITINLSEVVPMIAFPFHPSNVYKIADVISNPKMYIDKVIQDAKTQFASNDVDFDVVNVIKDNALIFGQGIIAGCSGGTYENIEDVSHMIDGKNTSHDEFALSVYPASQPINYQALKSGAITKLMDSGVVVKTAFCGPCFGAGDVPQNGVLSARHVTRNFPNREGSKPGDGQLSGVCLMDARSIAATAINGGKLTSGEDYYVPASDVKYEFNPKIYEMRVDNNLNNAQSEHALKIGPNIKAWPDMVAIPENLLLVAASVIFDDLTTTDELIPSGETSSYRSNPMRLAEYTLSRKDPEFVPTAKNIMTIDAQYKKNATTENKEITDAINILSLDKDTMDNTIIAPFIYANKPGDGSAREQAASCQKVLGTWANVATDYATKRYRSNCVNWGIIPFVIEKGLLDALKRYDALYVPDIKKALIEGKQEIHAIHVAEGKKTEIVLTLPAMSDNEREILLKGCLINYYRKYNEG